MGKSSVIASAAYTVKIMQNTDPDLENKLAVSNKLNVLSQENLTRVFSFTNGYVLSLDLPPHIQRLESISLHAPGIGIVEQPAAHYVYVFSEKVDNYFDALPDEPSVNENFFFEVLIALYYARKKWNLCHYDICEKNLMFNEWHKPSSRTYCIDTFYVTIANSRIEPKVVDYGRSEPSSAAGSDVHHLAQIFGQRNHLTERFRRFLKEEVATKLENIKPAFEKLFRRKVHCQVHDVFEQCTTR